MGTSHGETMKTKTSLEDTLLLMRDLRRRCEWDAAQTHESLRPYLIEEAYEVDDAIRSHSDAALREELGDLLLQVLFHSVIAEERGAFTFADVCSDFIAKMTGRHLHLYGDPGTGRRSWEEAKAGKRNSITDGLPVDLPALHRALRLQDRAAGVGFDWPDAQGPLEKVREELGEVTAELSQRDAHAAGSNRTPHPDLESELGDLLFSVVNLCRKLGIHPAVALDRTNVKFVRRFKSVEARLRERGSTPAAASIETMDALWEDAKEEES